MKTVDELLGELLTAVSWTEGSEHIKLIDALVSAVARREAAKIVHCCECAGGDENTPEKDQCVLWTEGRRGYCSRARRVSSTPTPEKLPTVYGDALPIKEKT